MKRLLRGKICNDLVLSLMFLGGMLFWPSCEMFDGIIMDSENVGSAYYTFTGETIASFLRSNPDFSEFCQALDTTGVIDLLSTYGTYTCFTPNNDAMRAYYADSGATSMKTFLAANPSRFRILQEMCFYQLIETPNADTQKAYMTTDFPEGRIGDKNMMARYIEVSFATMLETGYIMVDNRARILLRDQELHNGVIHVIDQVLVPSNFLLPELISGDGRYKLFSKALYATGISDKLLLYKDDNYKQPKGFLGRDGKTTNATPDERLYGFTAFVEPDSIYLLNGVDTTLEALTAYAKSVYDPVYPQYAGITDITDPNNSLNRFVAYHLVEFAAARNELMYFNVHTEPADHTASWRDEPIELPVMEYYSTMAPYNMVEISRYAILNNETTFNVVLADDGKTPLRYISMLPGSTNCLNGYCHPIDGILVYDQDVVNTVLNKRLRIDAYSCCPEMMTKRLRPLERSSSMGDVEMYYPTGFLKNFIYNDDDTKMYNPKISNGSVQYQGGMFYVYGECDFTHNLPPIPAGTWEIRIGTKFRGYGIYQLYVDGLPVGIPLDLGWGKQAEYLESALGFVIDQHETYQGQEAWPELRRNGLPNDNDKDMRNRGWMKFPDAFTMVGSANSSREDRKSCRRILGRYYFNEGIQHTIRVKLVGENRNGEGVNNPGAYRYFGYDFLEFMPTSQLETENIY